MLFQKLSVGRCVEKIDLPELVRKKEKRRQQKILVPYWKVHPHAKLFQ
jgi:hypothetical protein